MRQAISHSARKQTTDGNPPVELVNLANTLGLYTPSRDVYTQWAFGQDDTFQTLTISTANTGLAMDARHINTDMRSILIKVGGACNFDYEILAGRNNNIADAASIATAAAVTTTETLVNLPASLGYAPWLFIKITPNTGNLTYKAVLLGRGG